MNYSKIYKDLIKKAQLRVWDRTLSCEVHHITPICLGGTDAKSNLVKLSPKEHFLAHKLLVKTFPDNEKLLLAFGMMAISSKNLSRTRIISSKEYELLFKTKSKIMKDNNPMKKPEVVLKMQNTKSKNRSLGLHKAFTLTEEESKRRSNYMKENNPMYNISSREKVSSSMKSLRNSENFKWGMSEEGKRSISQKMREDNPMKNPEIAKKSAETFKQRKESGELVLIEGRWRKREAVYGS